MNAGEALGPGGRNDAVLVVGVYLTDTENRAPHIVAALARSLSWRVDQRWIGLGSGPAHDALAGVTVATRQAPVPKFVLLNELLASIDLDQYAFVIVCDDDITLPVEFLDRYLECVQRFDFALAQPARTHDSYTDHPFVDRLDGLSARWTRFVEIGPLFSIRRDAFPLLLPFDEASPMGWGFDFVWPCVLEQAGLKLGIVDRTPVAHSLRKSVARYDHETTRLTMERYLTGRVHLRREEAFFIMESYAWPE